MCVHVCVSNTVGSFYSSPLLSFSHWISPCLPFRLNRRCLGDHVRHMLVLRDYLTTKKVGLNKEEWFGGRFLMRRKRTKWKKRNVLSVNNSAGRRDKGGEEKHLNLGCIYIAAEVEQSQRAEHFKMEDGSWSPLRSTPHPHFCAPFCFYSPLDAFLSCDAQNPFHSFYISVCLGRTLHRCYSLFYRFPPKLC